MLFRSKHGAGNQQVELDEALLRADPGLTDVIAIDQALSRLEALDARKAQIVALRYFGGLSIEETAAALDLSPATVKNEMPSVPEEPSVRATTTMRSAL